MGSGVFDSGAYKAAATTRKASGVDDFAYTEDVRAGRAKGIHPSLDPKWVAGDSSPLAGQKVRESRDMDEHPNSLPIAIIFDVTGSMGGIPRTLQEKLVELMNVVNAKASLPDAQILVGAVGDSYSDRYPLQVGQFESDNRFDEQLRNIILEGGGGGQIMESYALAYYFAAFHTATDAWEKRGKKGYLFTMGDENPWPTVTRAEIEAIFGDTIERDYTVEELIARAGERWNIFHLRALDGSYSDSEAIRKCWASLLGERVINVEDSSLVCETIAGIVHMMENALDADSVVRDIGISGKAAASVKNSLVPVASSSLPTHVAKGGLPTDATDDSDAGVARVS